MFETEYNVNYVFEEGKIILGEYCRRVTYVLHYYCNFVLYCIQNYVNCIQNVEKWKSNVFLTFILFTLVQGETEDESEKKARYQNTYMKRNTRTWD